ncbi:uncharacterized protein EV154DRAFT_491772 [Mucor mucedo]|uniref:uncharacterized protein n=1 Tax=Mucor mucedo TaxID=29922 RepID=UPI00222112CF|nr:uncharacterized protein EV154DRAFT_491772 [Mucor mucedo]KAI7896659.1 hypothetical protein EV154DRAFT_491772 [Mucor mucedo]
MSGQVTYACNCLNVKLHLANKYDLDSHQVDRSTTYDPMVSGWHFQLGISGVMVEYPSLVSQRHESDRVIMSCLNCDSGDIYSVKKPIDSQQTDDKVTIYKGTIFGRDILKLQHGTDYSEAFRVVLNPNLTTSHVSLEKADTTLSLALRTQQKKIKQVLKSTLDDLKEATDKRIQAYRKEQELLLAREKEKIRYESATLWQTIKENSQSKQKEVDPDQLNFNGMSMTDSRPAFQLHSTETHIHDPVFDKDYIQQRRRSSVFTRDLFGESKPHWAYHRRTSHVPDESWAPHSLGKDASDELPPFQRRSSFIPQQHLHPLAAASTHKEEINMTLREGETHGEDMFALDEDIAHPPRKKSFKYLDLFDEENELNASQFTANDPSSSSPPAASSVKDEISQNRHVHPSSCLIDSTYFKERRPSFVGFDYAQVDRETSSQLPPLDMTRRKSSVTVTSNHVTSNNDKPNTHNNDDDRKDEGPMIPPHLFAANTVTDETEAIFGSVPRNSIRNRPID